MGKLMTQALSPKVLNHAWRRFQNDKGVWRPGQYLEDIKPNLLLHIGELSASVLNGQYRPDPVRCFDIAKADGKTRTICTSTIRDKLLQRAVLTVLEPLGEALFCDTSYGYRPSCTLDIGAIAIPMQPVLTRI